MCNQTPGQILSVHSLTCVYMLYLCM